jgi:tRNA dimethylallyltransferase
VGPTGTGKSETALRVAELVGGEIVGCDALQIYTGLDAATAKPPPESRRRVPHHLVDFADPRRDFNLADYVRAADEAIRGIAARRRVPIVVGGTGMYLRGLLRGVLESPARDEALRERLRRMAGLRGPARLHRFLSRLDPASAARVATGDTQRIVRALELALAGGGTWSERLGRDGTWSLGRERYTSLKVGLDMDREALVLGLAARVDAFFDAGLVEEVRSLLARGVPESANAFKAIGYREVVAAIRAGEDPDASREGVKVRTRRYAKRQRTWFRGERGITWLDAAEGPERLAPRIVALWLQGA